MPTAILVDGAFFLKRHQKVTLKIQDAASTAKALFEMCLRHLYEPSNRQTRRDLYRIFFYDCPPVAKKAHNPLTGKIIDFSKTTTFAFRQQLHEQLRKQRKVALRLGTLAESHSSWAIKPRPTKELLAGKMRLEQLSDSDLRYDIRQKGVDMRVGLDIASLCYKKLVDQIVLVAGDSDFVPAAKLARREGIDFILDPMWQTVRPDLHEHIDGLRSVLPRPNERLGSKA